MASLVFALAPPAQPPVAAVPAAQALSACRRVLDDTARLACFDAAAERLEQAQAQGVVVIVDRKQVQQIRRQAFGLNVPSVGALFRRQPGEEGDGRVTLKIISSHADPSGRWVLLTDEDQSWRQTDIEGPPDAPRAGAVMEVRRAALGSFFCKIDGRLAFRCARDR